VTSCVPRLQRYASLSSGRGGGARKGFGARGREGKREEGECQEKMNMKTVMLFEVRCGKRVALPAERKNPTRVETERDKPRELEETQGGGRKRRLITNGKREKQERERLRRLLVSN